MKIVVLDGYTLNPGDLSWDDLNRAGDLTVYDRTPVDKVVERAGKAEIIFTNKTPLFRETLKNLSYTKYIGVLATGYNVVDMAAAKEFGITVTNIPTYGTAAVAQMVFALLLEICNHVGHHSAAVRNGAWSRCPDFCFWDYPLIELAGKTMGLIGFGKIGQAVGKIALVFGMKVLAYDQNQVKSFENDSLKYVELDEVFNQSDIISLHCPLFDSTKGLINKKNIAKMKDGALIINTSRGPLIVEQDLAMALNSGKIAGAAVDVLSVEPPGMDNPLFKAKNCIITPHIAWAPQESRQRLMDIAVNNLQSFIAGSPVNVVGD
jgi:glycerate dehydrogenase